MQKKSATDLEVFFSKYKHISYKKRQMIIRAGDNPLGVFFIKKGYARRFTVSREGKELTTSIYKPLDIFSLGWVVNNSQVRYFVESITPVEVYRAPKDEFLHYIINQPGASIKLISRLLNRLDAFSQRMENFVFGGAGERVASILLILTDRFGKQKSNGICIQIPLTHKDIASLLGMARETISTEMKNLEEKKIFSYSNRKILIKNIKQLKRESSFSH
ncbi:MAG: Crp/Fnr family transcriptional regulator [Candidatus Levyibacteriota bacterium]